MSKSDKSVTQKPRAKIPSFKIGESIVVPKNAGTLYDRGAIISGVPRIHEVYGFEGDGFEVMIHDDGHNRHSNLSDPITTEVFGHSKFETTTSHGNLVHGQMGMIGNPYKGPIPKAKFHHHKFLGGDGGNPKDIKHTLKWILEYNENQRSAGKRGITHYCGSFGVDPGYTDPETESLYAKLKETNVKCSIASGNEYRNVSNWPANLESVFCIGAVDKEEKGADFSNASQDVDLVVWGVDCISTTGTNGEHKPWTGTSAAAPYNCGYQVLTDEAFLSLFGRLTSWDEMYSIQKFYATDLGAHGHDKKHGHGLVTLDCITDNFKQWALANAKSELLAILDGSVEKPTPPPIKEEPMKELIDSIDTSDPEIGKAQPPSQPGGIFSKILPFIIIGAILILGIKKEPPATGIVTNPVSEDAVTDDYKDINELYSKYRWLTPSKLENADKVIEHTFMGFRRALEVFKSDSTVVVWVDNVRYGHIICRSDDPIMECDRSELTNGIIYK